LSDYAKRDSNLHCLIGYKLSNTLSEFGAVSRGVCEVDSGGFLSKINERKGVEATDSGVRYKSGAGFGSLTGDVTVSMNMWGFHPSIFDQIDLCFRDFLNKKIKDKSSEYYIPDFIEHMIEAGSGRVQVVPSSDLWFGVTYKEDRPQVVARLRSLVDQGIYPPSLWS